MTGHPGSRFSQFTLEGLEIFGPEVFPLKVFELSALFSPMTSFIFMKLSEFNPNLTSKLTPNVLCYHKPIELIKSQVLLKPNEVLYSFVHKGG